MANGKADAIGIANCERSKCTKKKKKRDMRQATLHIVDPYVLRLGYFKLDEFF